MATRRRIDGNDRLVILTARDRDRGTQQGSLGLPVFPHVHKSCSLPYTRITVVGALGGDIDFFPTVQADIEDESVLEVESLSNSADAANRTRRLRERPRHSRMDSGLARSTECDNGHWD
jgi:hypothetical protein